MPRHIIVKFMNYTEKERILKATREQRSLTYKGREFKFTRDLSIETSQATKGGGRAWGMHVHLPCVATREQCGLNHV